MTETSAKISAYVPCYNNASTIAQTLKSLQAQTVPIDEIFVVDDGSADNSIAVAEQCGVRVIRNEGNIGRGATRAQAMRIARNEFVLGLDATKVVGPKFLERALSWNVTGAVAGVYGRIVLNHASTLPERWAQRQIYEVNPHPAFDNHGLLVTAGCLLRRSLVLQVGNFGRWYRHGEDRELGSRLLEAKYEVIFDPLLLVVDVRHKNLLDVLETYWRWNAWETESLTVAAFFQQVIYSLKLLAARDIKAGDPVAVFISLLSPYYQLWRSVGCKRSRS